MSSPWRPTCEEFDEPSQGNGFVLCRLNLYGGRPSLAVCNGCERNPAKGSMPAPKLSLVQVRPLTPEQLKQLEDARNAIYHRLWKTMHTKALAAPLTEADLDEIDRELPCGPCKRHFAALRAATDGPIDFAKTVGWHNTVRAEQGKSLMMADEARGIYVRY